MSLIPSTHWIEKITSGLFCQRKPSQLFYLNKAASFCLYNQQSTNQTLFLAGQKVWLVSKTNTY